MKYSLWGYRRWYRHPLWEEWARYLAPWPAWVREVDDWRRAREARES